MYENYENYQNHQNDSGFGEGYRPAIIEEKPKKSGAAKIIAVALCCSILGGALGAGGALAISKSTQQTLPTAIYESERQSSPINVVHVNSDKELTAAEVYAQNVNSTVGITTSIDTNFFGYRTTAAASGSGFILSENGYILTNYHVVEDGSSVTVSTYDGKSYPAEVVGYDSDNDVAVLKIEASGLTPAVLGSSGESRVGDQVCAIGNPLGELTFSLTSGVISALDRSITIGGKEMNLIQTDCAINSGNSGGALFNMYGEVIGITNAKLSNSSMGEASIDNIGFAIPIDDVKAIVSSIIADGTVEKPYIGVTVSTLGSEYRRFGLSGVVIQSVEEDSPAEKAGLKADDVITAVDGKEISQNSDLTAAIAKLSEGDKIKLSVTRQGEELEIEVTVGLKKQSALEKDDSEDEQTEDYFNGYGLFPWSGFGGSPM